ncbi:hypothetical protein FB45DRAFT_914784 [Roridomyces roridus]|uniref:MYND-type domain-containing protein n=1 Tax=Roridomyces roridus TaxID=1738132 RepID=A0AAD7BXZ1_9AGAR|nr:hypothetical protein FB45DRAFT_914784 [Roridomyces roridus]
MHESLRLTALQRLPFSIRRFALAAANGSVQNLRRIVKLLNRPNEHHPNLLLPVVYQLLDPSGVPSNDPYASMTPAEVAVCSKAMIAMDALSFYIHGIPDGAKSDLWDRVWSWFLYFETRYGVLENSYRLDDACARLVRCAYQLQLDRETFQPPPEFYSALSRAWTFPLGIRGPVSKFNHFDMGSDCRGPILIAVTKFLDSRVFIAENLERFVAPGPPLGYARFHFDYLLKHLRNASTARKAFTQLCGLVLFLQFMVDAGGDGPQGHAGDLIFEFVWNRGVQALMQAIQALAAVSADIDRAPLIDECFQVVQKLGDKTSVYPLVRAPISIGLVDTIAICAQRSDLVPAIHTFLHSGLLVFLPSSIIYWGDGTASQILAAMRRHESVVPRFPPDLRDAWNGFAAMAREPAVLSESLGSMSMLGMHACDNTLCDEIGPKRDFHRCSGCLTLYYCSVQCQRTDWCASHRTACNSTDYLFMTFHQRSAVKRCERPFIRALLHRDYTKNKLQIYRDIVKCLRAHPGAGYLVEFDYTCGIKNNITVRSLEESDSSDSYSIGFFSKASGLEWQDALARAARSEGRMAIHVVYMRQTGSVGRPWIVPLRSSCGLVHDELVRIASAGTGEEGLEGLAELVSRSDLAVTEIH